MSSERELLLAAVNAELLERVRAAIAGERPKQAVGAAIAALASFAEADPARARLAMSDALAAGARDARDRTVDEIAGAIEEAHLSVNEARPIPAVPGAILIGATQRVLARRLRRGEPLRVEQELAAWAAAYAEPARGRRWQELGGLPAAPPSAFVADLAPREQDVRLRLVEATAAVVRREGYAEASGDAIARAAGVEKSVFDELFAAKEDAFRAVHELAFQRTMEVTAGAYFSAEGWPERVWEAGRACTQYMDRNAELVSASLLEGQSGGPAAVERLDELLDGFTMFLQEGYRDDAAPRASPEPLALHSIAQATVELLYREARSSARPRFAALLGRLSYMSLAPFLGAVRAAELIGQMASGREG